MNMKLVSPEAYIQQATELINQAQHRVLLIAMVVAEHPATSELIEALKEAARRGVSVTVAADIFTYGEVNGTFLPLRYYSPGARQATAMAKALKAAGVHFSWLGHGRLTLFNGRTHSKWCVIDNTSFTFGGVNVYQDGISNADYMFRIDNTVLANRLEKEQDNIQRAERTSTNYRSVSFPLDDSQVLFDGGIIAHSIIYSRVCELAQEAKEVLFVSQYCPTARLARILTKHPSATLYFNRPAQATSLNRFVIKLSMFFSGLRTSYTKDRYLHAKFMIFTMPDGKKIAITGSHNFAWTGVLIGTREVALETDNPAVIRQLETFFKKEIV
jgi:cardiolipin synthase